MTLAFTVIVGEHQRTEDAEYIESIKYMRAFKHFENAYDDLTNMCPGNSIARIEIRDGDFVTNFNLYESEFKPLRQPVG